MNQHNPKTAHINRVVSQLQARFKCCGVGPQIGHPMNHDSCERGKNCADARDFHERRRHPLRLDVGGRLESHQTAFSPISSVRMRTACSTGRTNTFPSPIFLVLMAATTTVTAFSTMSSAITTSTFTLGRKSTVYSLPR